MSDLATFLLARIAEDEEWARRHGCADDHDGLELAPNCRDRVLAECEAKRRIVEQWRGSVTVMAAGDGDLWNLGQSDILDLVLALLALPYADHPDYRPEWKPADS